MPKKAKKTARKKTAKVRKPKKMLARAKKRVKKVVKKRTPKRVVAKKPAAPPFEMAPVLMEGMLAPDFRLKAYPEGEYTLSDLRDRKVVLYFYPKDDTPGCTMEACSFRDSRLDWEATGAVILGVSNDDLNSHMNFSQKYHLNFPLLADTNAAVSQAYGVYKEKNMYGKKFWGIERTTFIVNPEGRIAKIFPRVHVEGHSTEVMSALRSM